MTREEFQSQLPGLVKDYQPASVVTAHIGNITPLMIVGPSGVGKTTLIQRSGIRHVPSDTTRKPRPGEKEGVDFYFRRDYDNIVKEIQNGRFVQVAIGSGGDFYSTKDSSYPKSGLAIMAIVADAIPIFRSLGFKRAVTAFITPPSYEEWLRRLSTHPVTEQQRVKRLAEARRSFQFALNDEQTHFILNDSVDEAVRQLNDLVEGRVNSDREHRARQAADGIFGQISQSIGINL